MLHRLLLFFFAFTITVACQEVPRIEGSPYPASSRPDTLYRVIDSNYDNAQLLTIGTLQGLLAQKKPRIFRISNATYYTWLNDLKKNYGVTVITTYDDYFLGLLTKFKSEISSYVLCNLNDNSVNVAISLCGITNSVAITSDYVDMLNYLGIPMLEDVRGKDENWFFTNYGTQVNKKIFCFQNESQSRFISDYSVFGKMITFYNPSFDVNTDKIFDYFDDNAALFGWGFDEAKLVEHTSQFDIYVHAADYANNLSTLSNFTAEAKQKTAETNIDPDELKHIVCFLMTDGDNIQWMVSSFAGSPSWYASPDRGKTNIGWTMAPAMSELAPTLLKFMYDSEKVDSTGRDYFVAAPSGIGYMNPDIYSDLNSFADLTSRYMEMSDLSILNIIGNADDDKYLLPFTQKSNIDALLFYYYDNYARGGGRIKWVNGKPVIHGRYNLWRGVFDNAEQLAAKLNTLSKNIYSSTAYSLIPVHVWTESVTDVVSCANMLDSTVRVVTPDVFVELIKRNLGPRTEVIKFTPNNNATETGYIVPGNFGTGYDSLHRWADGNDKIVYHFTKADLLAKSNDITDLRVNLTVSNEYVVSIAENLSSTPTELFRWNKDTLHVHTSGNKKQQTLNLEKYINEGWEDIYIIFEDGIKTDGWGASIHEFGIYKPEVVTSVGSIDREIPTGYCLEQNYPNPFNPETTIRYNLNESGNVQLSVYDLLGRHVKTLVNTYQPRGNHSVVWVGDNTQGSKVASGIYLYRFSSGNTIETKKMVMLR